MQLVNAFVVPGADDAAWGWCDYAEYGEENRTTDGCSDMGLTPVLGLLVAPLVAGIGGWRYGAAVMRQSWLWALVAVLFFAPNVADRL